MTAFLLASFLAITSLHHRRLRKSIGGHRHYRCLVAVQVDDNIGVDDEETVALGVIEAVQVAAAMQPYQLDRYFRGKNEVGMLTTPPGLKTAKNPK